MPPKPVRDVMADRRAANAADVPIEIFAPSRPPPARRDGSPTLHGSRQNQGARGGTMVDMANPFEVSPHSQRGVRGQNLRLDIGASSPPGVSPMPRNASPPIRGNVNRTGAASMANAAAPAPKRAMLDAARAERKRNPFLMGPPGGPGNRGDSPAPGMSQRRGGNGGEVSAHVEDDEPVGTARGRGAGIADGPTAAAGARHREAARRFDDFEEQERLAGGPAARRPGFAAPVSATAGYRNPMDAYGDQALPPRGPAAPARPAPARTGTFGVSNTRYGPSGVGSAPEVHGPMTAAEKREFLKNKREAAQQQQQQEQQQQYGRGGSAANDRWDDGGGARGYRGAAAGGPPYATGAGGGRYAAGSFDDVPVGGYRRDAAPAPHVAPTRYGAARGATASRFDDPPRDDWLRGGGGGDYQGFYRDDDYNRRRADPHGGGATDYWSYRDGNPGIRRNAEAAPAQPDDGRWVAANAGMGIGAFFSNLIGSMMSPTPDRGVRQKSGDDEGADMRGAAAKQADRGSPLGGPLFPEGSESPAGRKSMRRGGGRGNSPAGRNNKKKSAAPPSSAADGAPTATEKARLTSVGEALRIALIAGLSLMFLVSCVMLALPMFVHFRHANEELLRQVPYVINMKQQFGFRMTTPACARCAYKHALNKTLHDLDSKALRAVGLPPTVRPGSELAAHYIRHKVPFDQLDGLARAHHMARHRARLYARSRDSSWGDALKFPLRDAYQFAFARHGTFGMLKRLLTLDLRGFLVEHVWEGLVCLRQDEKLPCPTYNYVINDALRREGLDPRSIPTLFTEAMDDEVEAKLRDVLQDVIAASWLTNEVYNSLCEECELEYGGVGVDAISDEAALAIAANQQLRFTSESSRAAERARYEEIDPAGGRG